MLLVEVKGYRGEDAKVKKVTTDTYCIPGVNHMKTFGRCTFVELRDVHEMANALEGALESAIAEATERQST